MAANGQLEKLTIQAFKDENFGKKVGSAVFQALINPETLTHTYGIEYTPVTTQGSNVQESNFDKLAQESLDFKIVLDKTGVVPINKRNTNKSVVQMINMLKKTVYNYQGSIHQPYFVKVNWGSISFNGRLKKLTVEYKLFKSNGAPVRALVSLGFIGYVGNQMAKAKANKNSPDMTHLVTIKEGDTLVSLCHDIYGKSKYYITVAEHNNLTNFRYLDPGTVLSFPPLK